MMYTIKQVAELLQVGTSLVAQFVESGELDAIDVSLKRGTRKRLRIPDDAYETSSIGDASIYHLRVVDESVIQDLVKSLIISRQYHWKRGDVVASRLVMSPSIWESQTIMSDS